MNVVLLLGENTMDAIILCQYQWYFTGIFRPRLLSEGQPKAGCSFILALPYAQPDWSTGRAMVLPEGILWKSRVCNTVGPQNQMQGIVKCGACACACCLYTMSYYMRGHCWGVGGQHGTVRTTNKRARLTRVTSELAWHNNNRFRS